MEEPTERKSTAKRFSVWPFIVWPAMILFLYILNFGPVILMAHKHLLNAKVADVLEIFYAPLIWAHEKTPLCKPLEVYVDLWVKDFDKKDGGKH
ncbi:MAG: hypothetical protein JWQ71_157 [Pedosphaera sp.]|nr:hypothetical protein [Pedosphaera sp.]